MRLPRLLILTLALSALVIGGCPWDDDDDDGGSNCQDAGTQQDPDPPDPGPTCADPCQGDLLFGAETFTRTTCEPVTETRSFVVANDGDVCILVTNAGNASSWIKIDGMKHIKPNDFNPGVTEITETVTLTAGTHELQVRLASQKDTSITLELRACSAGPPPARYCSEVAREYCDDKGWIIVSDPSPSIGNIVCTVDGRDSDENCSGCSAYNMVVWSDGSPEKHCPGTYSTIGGVVYGGHIPCTCSDNLYFCTDWDTQGCIID